MKLGMLSVLGSILLGVAFSFGAATPNLAAAAQSERATAESNPLRPSHLISLHGLDRDAPETHDLVARLLTSSGEFASFAITHSSNDAEVDGDGDAGGVKCGEGVGVVTPPNGMSGQGWGATAVDALIAAFNDCNDKLWAYSHVKCPPCPVPGCAPFISVLGGYKLTSLTQSSDGTWHAVVTASGAYIAGCTDCVF
ncbi:MAG: hypothetical protein HZA52_17205 [Planctomycetes bacterium]|nr:hypothetical protein [Planctomycetota bacterium]